MEDATRRAESGPETPTRRRAVRVVDIEETLIRRAGDLVNLVLTALLLVFVVLVAIYGQSTAAGVTEDVQEVVNRTARQFLLLPLTAIEALVTFLIPVSVVTARIFKRQWRTLIELLLAGALAAVAAWGVLWAIDTFLADSHLLYGLTRNTNGRFVPAVSPFVAALAAGLTAVGRSAASRTTRYSWHGLTLVLVLVVIQGDQTIAGALGTVLFGRLFGFLARYAGGVDSTRATGIALVTGMRRAGIDPDLVVRLDASPSALHAWLVSVSAPVGHNGQFGMPEPEAQTEPDLAIALSRLDGDDDVVVADSAPIGPEITAHVNTRFADASGEMRWYGAWQHGQRVDVAVLDADRQVVGFLSTLWETLRIRGADRRLTPTLLESAERAALMSFSAAAAGVRTPRMHGMAHTADSILIVQDHVNGARRFSELEEIPDSILDSMWEQLRAAHDRGIAHRSLSADHVLVDQDGAVWIVGWQDGEITASELSRRIDLAQALTMLAVRLGPERALASASRSLDQRQLASIAPLLQKVTLPTSTRTALSKTTLPRLREALTNMIPTADAEPLPLRRFSLKTVLSVSMLLIAAIVVFGSLNFNDVITSFQSANPWWLVGAFVAGLSTYWGAALGLTAFTPEKLGVWRTTLVQVASSIVSIVAPAGIGPAAIDIRFLTRRGVAAPLAVATVSLTMVTRFVVTVLLLLIVALVSGNSGSITLPSGWMILGIVLVIAIIGALVAIPAIRNWVWDKAGPMIRQIWPRLLWVLGNPRRMIQGFIGNVIMTAGYVVAFGFTLEAFGYSLPVAILAITYLASNSAGSLVPSPAGIGPVELALTSGLTVAGIPASVALSTTIVFRVLTLWARVPLGWAALRYLQRTNDL